MKTNKQKAHERKWRRVHEEAQRRTAEREAERRRFNEAALPTVKAIIGEMPGESVVAAILLRLAEQAYHEAVVAPQMEDMTEETKEEWIEGWLRSTIEEASIPAPQVT